MTNFHLNQYGCLPKDEYDTLVNALNSFSKFVFPALGGTVIDSVDYPDLCLLKSIDELQKNLDIVQDFVNAVLAKEG